MGDLLQPWHLLVLAVFAGIILFLRFLFKAARMASAVPRSHVDPNLPPRKFCSECGGEIARRAEICPLCGCRQG